MDDITALTRLVTAMPVLLVSLLIIVWALMRFPKHPTVSLLAIAAFAVHIAVQFGSVMFTSWMMTAAQEGASSEDIGTAAASVAVVQVFGQILFLVLAAVAIFARRESRKSSKPGAPPASPPPGSDITVARDEPAT